MAKESSPNAITAISVKGFKSFAKEQRIEIYPLTLLAGANSSGKSSALQPLLLLKQTLDASHEIRNVLWANPEIEDEAVVPWLEGGARVEATRRLSDQAASGPARDHRR